MSSGGSRVDRSSRYGEARFTRPALAPGILASVALYAGVALLDTDAFTYIRYAVAILAAVCAVFAWQAGKPLWLLLYVPVVVAWNPVWPIPFSGIGWYAAHLVVPIGLVLAGVFVRVPVKDARR